MHGIIKFGTGLLIGIAVTTIVVLFLGRIPGQNKQLLIGSIGSIATIATGVIVALITQSKSRERELEIQSKIRQREIEEAHRAKKVEIYSSFVNTVSGAISSTSNVGSKTSKKINLEKEMLNFKNGLILYGSPKLIRSYLEWMSQSEADPNILFPLVNNVYSAMREDIGLSNKGLEGMQLIQMYLKDPEEIQNP